MSKVFLNSLIIVFLCVGGILFYIPILLEDIKTLKMAKKYLSPEEYEKFRKQFSLRTKLFYK